MRLNRLNVDLTKNLLPEYYRVCNTDSVLQSEQRLINSLVI